MRTKQDRIENPLVEVRTARGAVSVSVEDIGSLIDSLASRVGQAYEDDVDGPDESHDLALLERINPAYADLYQGTR